MPAFLMPKLIEYAIILVMVSGLCTYLVVHYENIGYNRAITEVNTANKRASDAAAQARFNVEDCNNSGGTWDVTSGVCNLQPSP